MITIKISKNAIYIEGHADYAEHGKDIVCSAVSAVLQTAQLGLKQISLHYPNHVKFITIEEEDDE